MSSQYQQRLHPINLILPLCTSAATLGLSLFQYPLFTSFLNAERLPELKENTISITTTTTKISGTPLSCFWEAFLVPSASLIAGICLASTTSGLLTAYGLRSAVPVTPRARAMSMWFSCGAALALGHLAFVPAVAGPIRAIVNCRAEDEDEVREDEVREANEDAMREWLWWHSLRTVAVDGPALVCFAKGVLIGFKRA